jgi:hypothetical protein
MRHRQAHQIPRVIVEERRHVHALVLPQQEREQVRLPQLIGLRALEAHLGRLLLSLRARPRRRQAFTRQHPAHRRRRHSDPEEPLHDITDPTTARRRLLLLRRDDHRVSRVTATRCTRLRRRARCRQSRRAAASIPRHPVHRRRVWHAELGRRFVCVHPGLDHELRQRHSHVERPRSSACRLRSARLITALRCVLPFHGSSPPDRTSGEPRKKC